MKTKFVISIRASRHYYYKKDAVEITITWNIHDYSHGYYSAKDRKDGPSISSYRFDTDKWDYDYCF